MKLKTLALALMIGASLEASPAQTQEADPSELMKVTNYELVSKKRVGRTVFEYEYALTVENNTNTDYDGVFVTLTSPDAAFELTDATADIGAFNAFSSKDANDTIKVRVDRRSRFSPNTGLNVAFENNTIEGVDSNNNGIQDPVDVFLMNIRPSLSDKDNTIVTNYARLAQRQLNPTDIEDVFNIQRDVQRLAACNRDAKASTDDALEEIYQLTVLSLDMRFLAQNANYLKPLSTVLIPVLDFDDSDCFELED